MLEGPRNELAEGRAGLAGEAWIGIGIGIGKDRDTTNYGQQGKCVQVPNSSTRREQPRQGWLGYNARKQAKLLSAAALLRGALRSAQLAVPKLPRPSSCCLPSAFLQNSILPNSMVVMERSELLPRWPDICAAQCCQPRISRNLRSVKSDCSDEEAVRALTAQFHSPRTVSHSHLRALPLSTYTPSPQHLLTFSSMASMLLLSPPL